MKWKEHGLCMEQLLFGILTDTSHLTSLSRFLLNNGSDNLFYPTGWLTSVYSSWDAKRSILALKSEGCVRARNWRPELANSPVIN